MAGIGFERLGIAALLWSACTAVFAQQGGLLGLPPLPPPSGTPQTGLPPAGALVAQQVMVDGAARHYLLHTPTGATPGAKLPLVLVLHGNRQSAQQMANSATGQIWRLVADGEFPQIANRQRFYVAFLNGALLANRSSGPAESSTWNDCDLSRFNNPSTADDVGFAAAVVEQIRSAGGPALDLNKVYAYGFSNGAAMALRLGREAGGVVAAVAAISGVDPQAANDECVETRDGVAARRPALIAHGTADLLVPFVNRCGANAGALQSCRLGHAETVQAWKARSGQATFASDTSLLPPPRTRYDSPMNARPRTAPADTTTLECVQHLRQIRRNGLNPVLDTSGRLQPNTASDVRVENCVITGGGHAEPSILTYVGAVVESVYGKQNNDGEAVALAWRFFERHVR